MKPVKPFDTYKWRWLSVQPTENLLKPPIFLGVLRALKKCQGRAFSSQEIYDALALVEAETNSLVTLARNPDRNLLRNSGQYWRGTGLLASTSRNVELTALGYKVAEGRVTQGEFAAIMVQQAILPNPKTYTHKELKKWRDADLQIKPLILILKILEHLGKTAGHKHAYLTPNELINAVIPLAGNKTPSKIIAQTLLDIRNGKLSTSGWPNCAPESNDRRLAREFLLFLFNYGISRLVPGETKYEERFHLDELFDVNAISTLTESSIFANEQQTDNVIEAVRKSPLPSIIERQRTITTVLSRPEQPKFRKEILKFSQNQCLLTGEKISELLEAAHIIPVASGGNDEKGNGLCLRVDIHRLFDSGNIRIQPAGNLKLSDAVKESGNYKTLPSKIIIPAFVNMRNVEWRSKYC